MLLLVRAAVVVGVNLRTWWLVWICTWWLVWICTWWLVWIYVVAGWCDVYNCPLVRRCQFPTLLLSPDRQTNRTAESSPALSGQTYRSRDNNQAIWLDSFIRCVTIISYNLYDCNVGYKSNRKYCNVKNSTCIWYPSNSQLFKVESDADLLSYWFNW